jgi:hypothetical protein
MIALATPLTAHAYNLYKCSTIHQLTHFYNACLNYPVIATLIKAIHMGYFKGWLGLTANRIHHHIDVSVESAKGHIDQVRQGLCSTWPAP